MAETGTTLETLHELTRLMLEETRQILAIMDDQSRRFEALDEQARRIRPAQEPDR